jgi:hypothetical protein
MRIQLALTVTMAATSVLVASCVAPDSPSNEEHGEQASALAICGNNVCDTGEHCASCPADCGRCTRAHCGDDTCTEKETCTTCERDCGTCPGCGDNVCQGAETCANCPGDCGRCSGEHCGNGICGKKESCTTCAADCCPNLQCQLPADCPDPGAECETRTCTSGQCGTGFVASGTPLATQPAGDCREMQCNGVGGILLTVNDADVPNDGNECTDDACVAGSPVSTAAPAGSPCSGDRVCDGEGQCVSCVDPSTCPQSSDACLTATCTSGSCGLAPAPAGTIANNQILGDCQVIECDGAGGRVISDDDTDVPVDDNDCTIDGCTSGAPVHVPAPAGTPCFDFPGAVCDGLGSCVPS